MTSRLALGAGLAAILAAGPALFGCVPAQAAVQAAAKPHYVAVVISGHGTHCVKWKSGITGDTVLNDVADVGYRNDGIILTIDGDPTSHKADASHYWSYWHDTSGTWSYSNYGASASTPPAGSVEGWSFDNGRSSAPKPAQQPSGLYAKLCGAKDTTHVVPPPVASASATTRAAHTPTATPSHRAPAPRRSTPTPTRTSTGSAAPTRSSATAGRSTATPSGAISSSSGAAAPPASSTSPVASGRSATPASSAAPSTIDASPAASSSPSSGSPVGLLVALGLVVVLGAGAGAFALRRRGAGG